ncbi:MAG: DNA repair protein RecO [Bryobacteraceae bacterium]|nr:DNA repair protein RecO [Bryobacterales bacterium]MEB2362326.1 DNA repair protein RecO [Bryobacterales bacterium]NUN01441.1 DNA repair protein RecO [Bryobacteraceae bacterium]
MPARVSESILLRTYPLREADLIVSFLTRDQGKLRGVARAARRPKSRFGAGLERLSHVRMFYYQRENRELVTLDSCDLIQSAFDAAPDYEMGVAMDFLAEVSEQMLPAAEPNERHFRLLLAMMEHLRPGGNDRIWSAVTYFSLWSVRLAGVLPELRVASESRRIAEEMFRTPVGQLTPRAWDRTTAADLRRSLVRTIEDHIERKLLSAPHLESL